MSPKLPWFTAKDIKYAVLVDCSIEVALLQIALYDDQSETEPDFNAFQWALKFSGKTVQQICIHILF